MNNEQKVNLIAVLEDIQDQLLTELEPEFRHGMKQLCRKAALHTRHLIREFDKIHSKENQLLFGDAADKLREKIEFWVKSAQ